MVVSYRTTRPEPATHPAGLRLLAVAKAAEEGSWLLVVGDSTGPAAVISVRMLGFGRK